MQVGHSTSGEASAAVRRIDDDYLATCKLHPVRQRVSCLPCALS